MRFLTVQEKIDAWLDSLEKILPFTAKEKGEEIPNSKLQKVFNSQKTTISDKKIS